VQLAGFTAALVATTGQVVVVQPLPAFAADGVHDATATFEVLFVAQVVAVQELPAEATEATQVCTGTLVVLFDEQVVLVQPLPALGTEALQLDTATSTVSFGVQVVAVQLLPALATGSGTQDDTAVGPVLTTGQVVVTQPLGNVPGLGAQLPEGMLEVLFVAQAVVVKLLPTLGIGAAVHDATGTLVVTTGAGQVVWVHRLPALAAEAVQVATGTAL
jgi:hypothetical protein